MYQNTPTGLSHLVNVVKTLVEVLRDVGGRPVGDADPLVGKAGRVGTVDLLCHVKDMCHFVAFQGVQVLSNFLCSWEEK